MCCVKLAQRGKEDAMPKIIFKCRYLKIGAHAANLVQYFATREGVEKLPRQALSRPATEKQKSLIDSLLKQFPDTVNLFEYEDYLANQTVGNASECIMAALEQHLDQVGHKEAYVNYIATRPRVEKIGGHGLFSDAGTAIVFPKVVEEAARHAGNVWTPIISLRREDAARLGYDHAAAWAELLREQRNLFAAQMKITPENLRWYAAFHNEGHHPHCHMIVYSLDPREGYVSKAAIDKMRSVLAHEIFRQDLLQIYPKQTERRQETSEQSRTVLSEMISQMEAGVCENKAIEGLLTQLAERLRHTSGKKQYGYLKADVKALIDRIVDELAKDPRVASAYEAWRELRNEVLRTYADKLPDPLPLSQQKEFKSIKNMVIAEAMNIGAQEITFEGDENMDALAETAEKQAGPIEPEDTPGSFDGMPDGNGSLAGAGHADAAFGHSPSAVETETPRSPHIKWSDCYTQARTFLFGADDTEPDAEQAFRLFSEEAEVGNVLAVHDLGRLYAAGLGVAADAEQSCYWYAKALDGFQEIEAQRRHRYLEYRIGKMYAAGLGTEQDYAEAADWFETSASENCKYAQYALAGLYQRGQGVEKDLTKAFSLYQKAAGQRFPYASYELGKMYRAGVGTEKDASQSDICFREAFLGFKQLGRQSRDDRLLYRLGQMLYSGTGIPKDTGAAIPYLERAAKLGNTNAQYLLGKIYLSVDNLLNPVEKSYTDLEKGIFWLSKAADAGNDSAQYQLGKLYLQGKGIPKDVDAAVHWFTASAEQGRQYAQYMLGKLYLMGQDIPRDREAAIRWLTASAGQGNAYAQFFLDHLDSFRDPSLLLATTRLLRQFSRIFQDQQHRLHTPGMAVDSKLRRRLRQKKMAMGHAEDEQTPQQIQ